MNRPCFSLGVLLSSLAVCLVAVGSANSQTGFDGHSPVCLMCPYAGSAYAITDTFAGPPVAAASDEAAPAAETPATAPLLADTVVDGDYDYSDYDYSDYDYSDYDYSHYEATDDYTPDAGEAVSASVPAEAPAENAAANVDDSEFDVYFGEAADEATGAANSDAEFDNYDYEDYFAEIYGSEDAWNAAGEATVAADVVANDDVEPFDFFDTAEFAPAGDDTEAVDPFAGLEEFAADAASRDVADRSADEDAAVAESTAVNADLYDLRTTYDATYDEVMAPTSDAAATTPPAYRTTDHCFGGYPDPYDADYRCDLADVYLEDAFHSLPVDGPRPSLEETVDDNGKAIDREEVSVLKRADEETASNELTGLSTLPGAAEPYVALLMDRIGAAWQRLSLDAVVTKAVTEAAKLPLALAESATESEAELRLADYVDCHVEPHGRVADVYEIDCFGAWEPCQPIGLGVAPAEEETSATADGEAEVLDTAALEAAKASIRDLRSRMNAARQSPPLR